jgi:hypothetical protein
MFEPRVQVFLDSGAFTAWTKGETIKVEDYIRFVRQVEPYVQIYANLDVIPGSPKRVRTVEEVETSAQQSHRNWQIMKDAGLRPLPVFHQMERFRWLERMLRDGENYIGISTAKNMPDQVQNRWLDEFFSVVTDKQGRALIKVHAFGLADVKLLRRHPYYSVDSAGWTIAGAHGKIYVPPYVNGRPDYLANPELVSITGNVLTSPYAERRALANLSLTARKTVHQFVEEEVGINLGMARYSNLDRLRCLAVYYRRVAEAIKHVRFKHRLPFPFNREVHQVVKANNPVDIQRLNFFFATSYDLYSCKVLLAAGARHHLLSYWKLKNKPEVLQAYAMGGIVNNNVKVRKPIKPDWNDRRYLDFRGWSLTNRIREMKAAGLAVADRP